MKIEGKCTDDGDESTAGRVLFIAVGGLDPTGGAGLVRDLLTARALGARVHLVPAAWTEQSAAAGVSAVEPRAPASLSRALETAWKAAAAEAIPSAVKVGMLPDGEAMRAVIDALRGYEGPVVFDPVLGASSGGALFRDPPRVLSPMLARATLVTPNGPEAVALLGRPGLERLGVEDAEQLGRGLIDAGARAVLVKGGHLAGHTAVDTLVTATAVRRFTASRLAGPNVRGTGCALGTAIAVGLGRREPLEDAVAGAKRWLHAALGRAVAVGPEWHLD